MKKLSLLLAILLIVSFGVSAATDTSTDFHIQTSVGDKFGLVIHDTTATIPEGYADWNDLVSLAVGTDSDPIIFAVEDNQLIDGSKTYAITAMTNKNAKYTVETSATPLSAQGVSTKIGYSVTINSTENKVLSTDASKTIKFMDIAKQSGLSIQSQQFSIALSSDDWNNAESGTYSTTWTVNLISE